MKRNTNLTQHSKTTISVGVPAFNEEENIDHLLDDILKQDRNNFVLERVIVCSDGSSDNTVDIANKMKADFSKAEKTKLIVINNKKREGRAVRQNQIMKRSNSDVLVLIDADILIKDIKFLERIIKPISLGKADLTSVSVQELKPENFLERVLDVSMKFKKYIFENYNRGNNLYTCHGRARGFSKDLYKRINFTESVGEDAYSYFYAVSKGFRYSFVKDTEVFYKLPGTFKDHEKQSIRFYKTVHHLEKDFGKEIVKKENYLNSDLLLKNLAKYIFVNPLIILYFFLAAFLKIKSFMVGDIRNTWPTSKSSKKLRKVLV